MSTDSHDPVIARIRTLFAESGKTLDELGIAMGSKKKDVARKSAWQFLNGNADPRLSTLRKFAAAMDVPLSKLFDESEAK